jgi:hypothetical protein
METEQLQPGTKPPQIKGSSEQDFLDAGAAANANPEQFEADWRTRCAIVEACRIALAADETKLTRVTESHTRLNGESVRAGQAARQRTAELYNEARDNPAANYADLAQLFEAARHEADFLARALGRIVEYDEPRQKLAVLHGRLRLRQGETEEAKYQVTKVFADFLRLSAPLAEAQGAHPYFGWESFTPLMRSALTELSRIWRAEQAAREEYTAVKAKFDETCRALAL